MATSASPLLRTAISNRVAARAVRRHGTLNRAQNALRIVVEELCAAPGASLLATDLAERVEARLGIDVDELWRELGYESWVHLMVMRWRTYVAVVTRHYARNTDDACVVLRAARELSARRTLDDVPLADLLPTALALVCADGRREMELEPLADALARALALDAGAYYLDSLATSLVVASRGALVAFVEGDPDERVRLVAVNTA